MRLTERAKRAKDAVVAYPIEAITAAVMIALCACIVACAATALWLNAPLNWPLIEHAAVSLSEAWCWPVAAIIITYLFRKPIAELLRRLKLSKSALGEHEFFVTEPLERAEDAAATVGATTSPHVTSQERELLQQILRESASGRLAILRAWQYIEKLAAKAAEQAGLTGSQPYRTIGRKLRASGLLRDSESALLDDLRRISRNIVSNEALQPSDTDVARYYELAGQIAEVLTQKIEEHEARV